MQIHAIAVINIQTEGANQWSVERRVEYNFTNEIGIGIDRSWWIEKKHKFTEEQSRK